MKPGHRGEPRYPHSERNKGGNLKVFMLPKLNAPRPEGSRAERFEEIATAAQGERVRRLKCRFPVQESCECHHRPHRETGKRRAVNAILPIL